MAKSVTVMTKTVTGMDKKDYPLGEGVSITKSHRAMKSVKVGRTKTGSVITSRKDEAVKGSAGGTGGLATRKRAARIGSGGLVRGGGAIGRAIGGG